MSHSISLVCHPRTPAPWVRGLKAGVLLDGDRGLSVSYRLDVDLDRFRLPPPGPIRHTDGLWRHSCFEAFVAGDSAPAYREFNFSSSGPWAAYQFSGYRRGGEPLFPVDPVIVCRTWERGLLLQAVVPEACLPTGQRLRIGLTAVLEDRQGKLSYWALHHSSPDPDFHVPSSFTAELERLS